jgi:hypothetical protein
MRLIWFTLLALTAIFLVMINLRPEWVEDFMDGIK